MSAPAITPCPGCGTSSSEDYDGRGSCWKCVGVAHDGTKSSATSAQPAASALARAVRSRRLDDYRPQAVSWLWRDRIPAGELSILGGDGGLGKSTFLALLAAEVTRGKARGLTGTAQVVVALGEDDPSRVLAARYRAAGADMSRVHVLAAEDDGGESPVVLPDDLGALRTEVERLRPDLVIVDPVSAHLSGAVDMHRDAGKGGMRQVLNPLGRLAQTTGATVVCAVHLRKGAGPASDLLGGTKALRNAARNVLILAAHPESRDGDDDRDDGRRIVGHDKSNYGPRQPSLAATVETVPALDADGAALLDHDGNAATTSRIVIGETSDVDYEAALAAASQAPRAGDGGEQDALDDAIDFVRAELAGGPISSRALESAAADAGIARRTLRRARQRLGVRAIKGASGWMVSIDPDGLAPLAPFHENPAVTGDSKGARDSNGAKGARGPTLPRGGAEVVPLRPANALTAGLFDDEDGGAA